MDQKTRTGQTPQQNREQENDLKTTTPNTPNTGKSGDGGQQQQNAGNREQGKDTRKA